MPLAQFTIYSPQDFQKYVMNTTFSRQITIIQNHHTWEPDYRSLTAANGEMYWLEAMRSFHIHSNGWSDIGQNITTFPSGNIGLCRPIDITPAGIFGANKGAICIENLGNFDAGHDIMTQSHKDTITFLNALLCIKFNLSPVKEQVVYHHWFDKTGNRFSDDKINNNLVGDEQKTCPGTAFFGTNTITSAEINFYPLIKNKIEQLNGSPLLSPALKTVNADVLNVRGGPGTSFPVLRTVTHNTQVRVFTTLNGWSKISNTAEDWVFSALLT
jgi:Bacterial SH3 domain/N-acetylmuramoyl-L-alanine amidase